MKDHVKILVLGDSGVGKSSLISSYVSRYFSHEVPTVVTDCYLRSDTTASGVAVTIMDSSTRQGDREILIHKIRAADSIIACYDTSRLETLDSLSSKWLPLIQDEKPNNAKVIVAGTKVDLLGNGIDGNYTEEEKRIQELFKLYPICLLAMRSSSKLLNVDPIFYHAEQVVTYPLGPIYDTTLSQFTSASLRAFYHIFRAFDWDCDGLLNDTELNRLHAECYHSSFNHEELIEFKKQIAKFTSNGIRQNKVSFEGLIAMIKKFIDSSQFVTPWAILRRFDYDDDLNLEIPPEIDIIEEKGKVSEYVTQLSTEATDFLVKQYITAIDHIKAVDLTDFPTSKIEDYFGTLVSMEGKTDAEINYFKAIAHIFSVVMPSIPMPWNSFPIFEDVEEFKLDIYNQRPLKHKFLWCGPPKASHSTNYVDSWLLHWHILSMYRPSLSQVLLYRLGYVERPSDKGIVLAPGRCNYNERKGSMSLLSKPTIRICILGRNGVGKRSFVWALSKMPPIHREIHFRSQESLLSESIHGDGNASVSDIASLSPGGVVDNAASLSSINALDDNEIVTGGCLFQSQIHKNGHVNIIATAIPLEIASAWIEAHGHVYDAAVLVFQNDSNESLESALDIESKLPPFFPRIFVANKAEAISSASTTASDESPINSTVVNAAKSHVHDEEICDVQCLSVFDNQTIDTVLGAVLGVVQDPSRGVPRKNRIVKEPSVDWVTIAGTVLVTGGVALYIIKNRDQISNNLKALFGRTSRK